MLLLKLESERENLDQVPSKAKGHSLQIDPN
jgi:hypothetical protein